MVALGKITEGHTWVSHSTAAKIGFTVEFRSMFCRGGQKLKKLHTDVCIYVCGTGTNILGFGCMLVVEKPDRMQWGSG